MHLCISVTGRRVYRTVWISYLALVRADLWVGGDEANYSMYFLLCTARLVSSNYCFFDFARFIIQHLGILAKYQGLLSSFEGSTWYFCVQHFWKRLQSFQRTWWKFLNIWFECFVQSSWWYPILSLGFCVHMTTPVGRRSCWFIIFTWFPLEKGLQSSRRDCFSIASNVRGSLLHDLCFRRSLTKKVFRAVFHYLSQDFFQWRHFIFFCINRRGLKWGNKKKVVSTVLPVFDYWLNLSHSDFAKCCIS